MTAAEFLSEIDNIIQADPGTVQFSDRLKSLRGWDSMGVMMFIAMADERFGISVNPKDVASCASVEDLASLCGLQRDVEDASEQTSR